MIEVNSVELTKQGQIVALNEVITKLTGAIAVATDAEAKQIAIKWLKHYQQQLNKLTTKLTLVKLEQV
jgi:hypothetical protein